MGLWGGLSGLPTNIGRTAKLEGSRIKASNVLSCLFYAATFRASGRTEPLLSLLIDEQKRMISPFLLFINLNKLRRL
jgi:hypothetical protein